ncbi:MAG: 16S rRNA (cytidine(1402)-2'-O)-methyltransferase [Bacteroidales bacterium]|nr:16S rRNA (cytidine(1402)-2'-O)-methyltransferase [Bacteroidales bacterium]
MGKLFIVPTPIGNLEDITLRSLRILKEVDFILAEDTRQTIKLLQHYDIKTPLKAYHQYNEHHILDKIIDAIKSGKRIALVSDAGTPAISDPGFLIVREAIQNQIEVECLPGATALIPALVDSGFPCDRFIFEGFLPHKKGRKKKIEEIAQYNKTCIIYESPFRLLKTLEELDYHINNKKQVCVCREISKLHESIIRGSFKEVIDYFKTTPIKGEIVIVISTANE